MRLPIRHRPPKAPAPPRYCAYLDALAAGLCGVSLHAAARKVAPRRSRGRHGAALQWHLGLAPHEGSAEPDWEGTVEVKLVSVHRTADGRAACDKLKVCDATFDPYARLSSVLFVYADRLSRFVLGYRWFHLGPAPLRALAEAFSADPHFERPALFVESRGHPGRSAPAYYLSARFLQEFVGLPDPALLARIDPSRHRRLAGREPLWAVGDPGARDTPCPRCGGTIYRLDEDELFAETGWARAVHRMPVAGACTSAPHALLHPRLVPPPPAGVCGSDEQSRSLACAGPVLRVSDRVLEPEDHEHPLDPPAVPP